MLYGAVDDEDFAYLVSLPRQHPPPEVVKALEPFKPLLETRAEIARIPAESGGRQPGRATRAICERRK